MERNLGFLMVEIQRVLERSRICHLLDGRERWKQVPWNGMGCGLFQYIG